MGNWDDLAQEKSCWRVLMNVALKPWNFLLLEKHGGDSSNLLRTVAIVYILFWFSNMILIIEYI